MKTSPLPLGTDMQAVLAIVNSPKALGITVMTGDAWRDEEVQHTEELFRALGAVFHLTARQ